MAEELKALLGIKETDGLPTERLAHVIINILEKLGGLHASRDPDFYVEQLGLDAKTQVISGANPANPETINKLNTLLKPYIATTGKFDKQ